MAKQEKFSEVQIWRTGISQASWCHTKYKNNTPPFEPVELKESNPFYKKVGEEKCYSLRWFDNLFGGGIKIPDSTIQPITMLITGPPGGGKSTLALEMAYRLAKNEATLPDRRVECLNPTAKRTVYISTETTSKQIGEKMKSFFKDKSIFESYYKNMKYIRKKKGGVILFGMESIKSGSNILKIFNSVFKVISPIAGLLMNVPKVHQVAGISKRIADKGTELTEDSIDKNGSINLNRTAEKAKLLEADILVIDSLNNLPKEENKEKVFSDLLKKASKKNIQLIIFILDSDPRVSEHKFWEYVSDYVIRMEPEKKEGYFLRTLEIIKSRYCENVLGRQIIKITHKREDNENIHYPCRHHPYREEGGIFVYPSLHYFLSAYKRIDKANKGKQVYVETYPESFNQMINTNVNGLLPEGRCSAFIGDRGGHKSHFGYLHLLYVILQKKESAIIISLRDDEEMTRHALINIIRQEKALFNEAKRTLFTQEEVSEINEEDVINKIEINGNLEILYYHPGYISPEEFTHKMLMSVMHHKEHAHGNAENPGCSGKVTLLFNSLDQIFSRFPLCSSMNVFIPGIVDILNGEGVTSIFVAVDTPDQPVEQYGILPMADLVLSFRHKYFKSEEYLSLLNQPTGSSYIHDAIIVENARSAGGEMAGSIGLLELVSDEKHSLYKLYNELGLKFTQLPKPSLVWVNQGV